MPYAVVDFETTGLFPGGSDRVAEVGVVHVESDGTVSGRWGTVVNPYRDLGKQGVHGIAGRDLVDAPDFSDIAPELASLLQGRVFVAHNAGFDMRFLMAEFDRAGHSLEADAPELCTMLLGDAFGLGRGCSLASACDAFGIELDNAHCALDDAIATAQLLGAYLRTSQSWPGWGEFWGALEAYATNYQYPVLPSKGVLWQGRKSPQEVPGAHILDALPHRADGEMEPGAGSKYLTVLDRCLLSGRISVHDSDHIVATASALGMSREDVRSLHAQYLDQLIEPTIRTSGEPSEEGLRTLMAVGKFLGFSEDAAREVLTYRPSNRARHRKNVVFDRFRLAPGDMIALTGDLQLPRTEWVRLIDGSHCEYHSSVTKKISLLAAADQDSQSAKACKARKYGVPIVDEAGLARLLGLNPNIM